LVGEKNYSNLIPKSDEMFIECMGNNLPKFL
jgi:hypothetical protein